MKVFYRAEYRCFPSLEGRDFWLGASEPGHQTWCVVRYSRDDPCGRIWDSHFDDLRLAVLGANRRQKGLHPHTGEPDPPEDDES